MPQETPKKYYLTTPIYYVNARPHIGHAYTTIVADVLARRHRLLGEEVFFLTGTDEHGQKIERSAAAAGIPPQQFADEVAASFEALWKRMGITNDKFIRTTDAPHARGVQKLFTELYNRGFIYLSTYTGAYCVSDEAFVEAPVGTPCPDCGRLLEEVTEENFFFKLSAFQRPLIDLIESGTLSVEPESRRNEVLSFLRGPVNQAAQPGSADEAAQPGVAAGFSPRDHSPANEGALAPGLSHSNLGNPYVPGVLKDLSVSRSSFTWGIPVPAEVQKAAGATQNHVIYVWLDALANYITAIGYGDSSEDAQASFEKWWPANLQLVGKEIIRFHCVYWPAFLLALNPELQHPPQTDVILTLSETKGKDPRILSEAPQISAPQLTFDQHKAWAAKMLPKAITAHGWLLFDNSKMSKSKGNIVRTETILQAFGTLCLSSPSGPSALDPGPSPHERDLFASDILRYFLLREIPFGQDGSFSFEALITRYNADLANGYGNLVSRTLNMIQQYCEGDIPSWNGTRFTAFSDHRFKPSVDAHLTFAWETLYLFDQNAFSYEKAIFEPFDVMDFSRIVQLLAGAVALCDIALTSTAPWKLAKISSEKGTVDAVLYEIAENIRIITALLYPILPYATARVWAQLGLGDIEEAAANGELKDLEWGGMKPGTRLGPLAPIFPRADKGLAQIMTDLENSQLATGNSKLESKPDRPEAPLKQATTPAHAAPVPHDPTHPAAPPRAFEPEGALSVAGSHAHTTGPDGTPSHTQATASGIFAKEPSGPSTLDREPSDSSPQITIDDFAKVELRVAEIKVCERIPKADKLLRLEVDLGHERRQILSGIAEHYAPEDLIGRRIIVITNLAPRKMRGLDSHGMLLAASGPEDGPDGGKPILASVGEGVPLGTRLK